MAEEATDLSSFATDRPSAPFPARGTKSVQSENYVEERGSRIEAVVTTY